MKLVNLSCDLNHAISSRAYALSKMERKNGASSFLWQLLAIARKQEPPFPKSMYFITNENRYSLATKLLTDTRDKNIDFRQIQPRGKQSKDT